VDETAAGGALDDLEVEGEVGDGGDEDPTVSVDGAAVEDLDQDLDVVPVEEVVAPGSGGGSRSKAAGRLKAAPAASTAPTRKR